MGAEEEEEVVHDDHDDKEDQATQKRTSNGLQAPTGETRSTCSFLGSLLRWSSKPQLDASEPSQPGTSKQKEATPKLSDVQVGRNTPPRRIINLTAHACLTIYTYWLLNRHPQGTEGT